MSCLFWVMLAAFDDQCLDQALTNPRGQWICSLFCKESSIGTQLHPMVYVLSFTTFVLEQQSGAVLTETICLTKKETFVFWLFTENVC